MTTTQLKAFFFKELEAYYTNETITACWRYCLEFALKMDPLIFIKEPDKELEYEKYIKIKHAAKKLKKQEPIQYIVGKTWFCDSIYKVSSSVLIPRPETQELVKLVCNHVDVNPYKILDIGTGSGCIAISIKKFKPQTGMMAVDVSEAALEIARTNAKNILANTSIFFFNANVLLKSFTNLFKQKFDIIVSNPPYIPYGEIEKMSKRVVDFEPHVALFTDDDPLIFYKEIMEHSKKLLNTGGALFFEVHENYGFQVKALLEKQNQYQAEILNDSFGKIRFIKAIKNL